MQINYDELRRIYRLEKNTSRLVEVDEDFFDSLEDFVREQKEIYLKSLKDLSSSRANDFTNMKKMIEEIFSLREKKLLNKALVSSRTGDLIEEKMASQEKECFNELIKILNSHKKILNSIFSVSPEKKQKSSALKLKALKSIPAFVGADMKEYGPFEKDSIIEIPEKIAGLLISRKLVQKE